MFLFLYHGVSGQKIAVSHYITSAWVQKQPAFLSTSKATRVNGDPCVRTQKM